MDRPSYAVLLGQQDVWVDGVGRRQHIQGMSPQYCLNLHAYLLREAPRIASELFDRMQRVPTPQGEVAGDDYDAITEELLAATTAPESSAWMRRQPLMRALEERIHALGEDVDGDTRTVTITLKVKVPNTEGSDIARRAVARTLRGLPYEHEITSGD